ncbi:MAG TPA: class IV adenylate cyclase [Dongiaceae bacterium]|nr:class IV adenylate cyclase [Dongiaceae bacterium]
MAEETEIKLPVRDAKAFARKLKKLGAKTVGEAGGRVHELNIIFDTPEGGLAKHGQLLRIRTETPQAVGKRPGKPRVIVTFKQPTARGLDDAGARFKVREETEAEAADAAAMAKVFEGLGLRGWFSYEKFRTTWKLPARAKWAGGLLIEMDETPVGTFVELEGPPAAIDRAARELGYSRGDYLLKNYLTLYAEDCRRKGVQPGNMLFEADPRRKK